MYHSSVNKSGEVNMIDTETYIPDPTVENAVETTPVVETKEEVTDDMKSVKVYRGRLDNYMSASDVRNPFLRLFLKDIKDKSISDQVLADTSVVRSRKCPGFWEEGGCDTTHGGRALIVTGPKGQKLTPIKSYVSSDTVNGQHALLPVAEGHHVIVGGEVDNVIYIADYVISSITAVEKGYKAMMSCAGCYTYTTSEGISSLSVDPEVPEAALDPNGPAITAAIERVQTENARCPAYVNEYVEHRLFMDDYIRFVTNKEVMSKSVKHATLDDAYAVVNNALGTMYTGAPGVQNILLTSVNYYSEENVIKVFLLIGLYDNRTDKQFQPLEAHTVVLPEGSPVYYIDNPTDKVMWDDAVAILNKRDGVTVSAMRRVVGIPK